MMPAVMMQIDKIPLTVNQKVDKKALPKPELKKAAFVAPQGKTEEDICAVFVKHRISRIKGRIKIVLVGEELGY